MELPQLPRKTMKVPSKTTSKKNPDKTDVADKEMLQGKHLFSSSDSLDVVPLKSQIEEMTMELNSTKEPCKLLQSTISSKLNVIQELEQDNVLLGIQMKELRENLGIQEDAYNSLSANFNKQSVELQHCRTELSYAQNKIATQEEQILEFKCMIVELNEVVNNLEETTAEQEKEIEALNEKLDHQRDCAKAATQQITNLSSELERHKNFSHQATEHLMNLTNTNNEQQKQIHCLTVEIKQLKTESCEKDCRLQDISFELTTTQQNARESAEQIKALEGLLESSEKQLQELARDYEQKCKDSQHYMARIAVLEDTKLIKQELSNALNEVSALLRPKERLKSLEQIVRDLDIFKAEAEKVKELQTMLTEEQDKELQWMKRYLKVYSLIGPFKEQLEAYRAECQQKIQHLVKLNKQNFELKKEVQKLRRTVYKLLQERATSKPPKASMVTPGKGKENHTPNCKSLPSSPSTKPFSEKNAM